MSDRPYRTLAGVLNRVSLGFGLLIPLIATACGPSQAAGKADPVDGVSSPTAALATVGVTPTAVVRGGQATHTPTPSPTPEPATPTPIAGAGVAPDFQLPDVNGTTRTLSEFRGQPVMLFFWATW